ncbi:MAG: hypothetical protein OXF78_12350 [Rhodospirillales bacterium]|nr:hypothetical protein [Rhodospirillales bacterium]
MKEIEGPFAEIEEAPVEPAMARLPSLRPVICLRLAVSQGARGSADESVPIVIDALRAIELGEELKKAAQIALFLSRDFLRQRQP